MCWAIDPRKYASQSGAALAYVVGILAIASILTSLAIRNTRFNDALVSRHRGEVQADLMARSGIDFALMKLDPPGPNLDLSFTSPALEYHLNPSGLKFHAKVSSHGLFGGVSSEGFSPLPSPGRKARADVLVGQALDLGQLPALTLTNREGNMVLAGNAQVLGSIMLWRGGVRKATDYHVRWHGKGGHLGAVLDSTAKAWSWVQPDFSRANDWVESQEGLNMTSYQSDDETRKLVDLGQSDSIEILDTAMTGVMLKANNWLRVGKGSVLSDCILRAQHLVIDGNAMLDGVLAYASQTLIIHGGALIGGQYVARDSLSISTDEPLKDWPVFYVHGRRIRSGFPDSSYQGHLKISRASGEGIFISGVAQAPIHDQAIRLQTTQDVDLKGLFYCGGYADIQGRLKGSLICKNLRFAHQGTIWLGHLKDAQIEGFGQSQVIPAPLVFPGFPLITLGRWNW